MVHGIEFSPDDPQADRLEQLADWAERGLEAKMALLKLASFIAPFLGPGPSISLWPSTQEAGAAGGLAPEMSSLLRNATQVFRRGPLTNVGHALTKHPNIIGESGNILHKLGGAANVNTAAARALENIMRTGTMTRTSTAAYGDIIQFKLESGLGARFSATTGEFIGFIGRGL